jgi:hypothetical protein
MPQQHLISILCQKAGITGTISLKPDLVLTPGELQLGRRAPLQVAIQSSGLDARYPMRNKNWSLERYQGVVSALKNRYDFVQVGSRNDPPLEGALDLRGQTTVRETAAVLHGSLAFVGQVHQESHLARAVECRSVIVYGGRETPAQSGYPCNENLYSAVICSCSGGDHTVRQHARRRPDRRDDARPNRCPAPGSWQRGRVRDPPYPDTGARPAAAKD